ncbi:hypothetical protein ACOSQ4_010096 [Xanthoceras sorbifolium]
MCFGALQISRFSVRRTKNRPSSSILAASLLTSGSTALVAMGFDGYINSSQFDPSSLCNNNSSAVLKRHQEK